TRDRSRRDERILRHRERRQETAGEPGALRGPRDLEEELDVAEAVGLAVAQAGGDVPDTQRCFSAARLGLVAPRRLVAAHGDAPVDLDRLVVAHLLDSQHYADASAS